MATDSIHYRKWGNNGRIDEMKEALRIKPEHYYEIHNCDHMLHLQQPVATAEVILDFFKN